MVRTYIREDEWIGGRDMGEVGLHHGKGAVNIAVGIGGQGIHSPRGPNAP